MQSDLPLLSGPWQASYQSYKNQDNENAKKKRCGEKTNAPIPHQRSGGPPQAGAPVSRHPAVCRVWRRPRGARRPPASRAAAAASRERPRASAPARQRRGRGPAGTSGPRGARTPRRAAAATRRSDTPQLPLAATAVGARRPSQGHHRVPCARTQGEGRRADARWGRAPPGCVGGQAAAPGWCGTERVGAPVAVIGVVVAAAAAGRQAAPRQHPARVSAASYWQHPRSWGGGGRAHPGVARQRRPGETQREQACCVDAHAASTSRRAARRRGPATRPPGSGRHAPLTRTKRRTHHPRQSPLRSAATSAAAAAAGRGATQAP